MKSRSAAAGGWGVGWAAEKREGGREVFCCDFVSVGFEEERTGGVAAKERRGPSSDAGRRSRRTGGGRNHADGRWLRRERACRFWTPAADFAVEEGCASSTAEVDIVGGNQVVVRVSGELAIHQQVPGSSRYALIVLHIIRTRADPDFSFPKSVEFLSTVCLWFCL